MVNNLLFALIHRSLFFTPGGSNGNYKFKDK